MEECRDFDLARLGVLVLTIDIPRLARVRSSASPRRGGLSQIRNWGLWRRGLHAVSGLSNDMKYMTGDGYARIRGGSNEARRESQRSIFSCPEGRALRKEMKQSENITLPT